MIRKQLAMTIALFFLLQGSSLATTLSVSSNSTNLRSYPDLNGSRVLLQVPRYYPLRVKEKQDDFYKVQDYQARTGWIHNSVVDYSKGVVVKSRIVNIRRGPGTQYGISFKAQEGVAFKVLQEKGEWLQVMHESSRKGWIYKPLVWGL